MMKNVGHILSDRYRRESFCPEKNSLSSSISSLFILYYTVKDFINFEIFMIMCTAREYEDQFFTPKNSVDAFM
jgi:hypothetical protein